MFWNVRRVIRLVHECELRNHGVQHGVLRVSPHQDSHLEFVHSFIQPMQLDEQLVQILHIGVVAEQFVRRFIESHANVLLLFVMRLTPKHYNKHGSVLQRIIHLAHNRIHALLVLP